MRAYQIYKKISDSDRVISDTPMDSDIIYSDINHAKAAIPCNKYHVKDLIYEFYIRELIVI